MGNYCLFISSRFNYSLVPHSIWDNVDKMLFIFLSKIGHECGDDCKSAKSEKEISVRMNMESIETDLTWDTDESYQISIVTKGKF